MTTLEITNGNKYDIYKCNHLAVTDLIVYLTENIDLVLNQLPKFINLTNLVLSYEIIEIKGLSNLTSLTTLNLSLNKITEIKGLNNLVNLTNLNLHGNRITEIKELNNLVNLTNLNLSLNKIKEIKGLDNLVNLTSLDLSNNLITEIKELNNLVNLTELNFCGNKITEIKGLDSLVNLTNLSFSYNKITEIKGLNNLVNLNELFLVNNHISELPLELCNLQNITKFYYYNNPIEYIPLPVHRWLDRLNRGVTENNIVYNDGQNIHNHHIQNSFRRSLTNILKDKQLLTLEMIKQQIVTNDILTEQTKREILNYCDDTTEHSTYLITYSDLLIYVWSRIASSKNKNNILLVLNQEISDGLCKCFTGRMTRLLNCLVGFFDDIEIQISDSEQITNIIISLKNKISNNDELKEAVKQELTERQYDESVINEWLEYI